MRLDSRTLTEELLPAIERVQQDAARQASDMTRETVDDGVLSRIADLVERYHDLPLGAAEASVVAVAERMRVTEVMTIDVRDFPWSSGHVPALTLLPR